MFKKVVSFVVLSLSMFAQAFAFNDDLLGDNPFASNGGFLEVDQAFILDFNQKGNTLELTWQIADGYYLYADHFKLKANGADLISFKKPDATQIEDEFFGITDVYFFETKITVELDNITDNAEFLVRYQGCAKAGLCYQPITKTIPLSVAEEESSSLNSPAKSEQHQLAESLLNENLLWTLLVFFGLGVGLAATPCVFPMFPILSGIIAGQANLTVKKGLFLAFVYVQGMALTYSLLGLVVASMGSQFQAYLQHPAILIVTSLIFVLLAGAMFGWYNLQLPSRWTEKLTAASNKQKGGNIVGIFMMGLLSGLIASPCTTAPLTGALLYVAQTGDLFTGFITLYVLSLGMGLPLLLIGASGGSLMPKAGKWMDFVKVLFGFILLAVPLILLERILDFSWVMIIAGCLLLALAAFLHTSYLRTDSAKAKGIFWIFKMAALLVGLLWILQPNLSTEAEPEQQASLHQEGFEQIATLEDLAQKQQQAISNQQVMMFDLYADWCVACKEFEAYVFSDPKVKEYMSRMKLVQVDMTKTSDKDIAIMEEFDVLGLPTIIFFDKNGNELVEQRVTGFVSAEEFSKLLANIIE